MQKKLVWTPHLIRTFWTYQASRAFESFSYQAGSTLLRFLKNEINSCHEVLDYGCGQGFFIEKLLLNTKAVTAMEFTPALVEYVRKKFGDHPLFRGVYSHAELVQSKKQFDAVFVLEVIEHLDDVSLSGLFQILRELVATDGYLILTTPNNENLVAREVFCPSCEHNFHPMQHVRAWSSDNLTEFCKANGFSVENIYVTDLGILSHSLLYRIKYYLKRWLGRAESPNLICVARPTIPNGA